MIFGEIIPQSIACRYGMAMGANTIYITYVFVALLFPVAYPIAKACPQLAFQSPSPVADHVMDSLLHPDLRQVRTNSPNPSLSMKFNTNTLNNIR
jgi:CBS domain containing-hemolysin-like protein